jgi:hypothetical protein
MPRKAKGPERLGESFSAEDADRAAHIFRTKAEHLPEGPERADLVRRAKTYLALAEMKRFLKPTTN